MIGKRGFGPLVLAAATCIVLAGLMGASYEPRSADVQKVQLEDAAGDNLGINSDGSINVLNGAPAAANVLAGYQSFTSTTAATTIVTVPAGRTWAGEINVNCVAAIAAASATAGQATGIITTAGANVTPTAGTYLGCDGRAGANAATGTVGSNGQDSADATDFVVIAPAGNAVTLQCTSTNAGNFSRVTCAANGRLI